MPAGATLTRVETDPDAGCRYTVANVVTAALAPGVPSALLPASGRAAVPPGVGRLDGRVTDFFGFEIHLGRPEPAADFLVCVKRVTGGRERLAAADAVGEAWHGALRPFLAAWADEGNSWGELVDNLWLEFDLVAPQRAQPSPSVFFGAERLIGRDGSGTLPGLLHASGLLRGGDLSPAAAAATARALDALPTGAAIFQIGQMMARPNAPVRLCVRGIHADRVGGYLDAVGLGARRRQATDLLAVLSPQCGAVDLDLDVDEGFGPRIGLECRFSPEPMAQLKAREALFAWLVAEGLCLGEKADAVRGWDAIAHCRRHRELWPRRLAEGDGDERRAGTSCFLRFLHHVKLVAGPGGGREAKAYLGCLHRFVPDAVLKAALDGSASLASAGTTPRPAA